ncbi:pentapeptide repeat-containing protein [Coleofasciculus sp. FACHB-1120]|uniref:pentapeptide repeat-containing protein n=1 Tax=Coleofasciculus sp. FACHB-1120 TaxID=2692783 RepID=UPI001688CCA3|nr:pentapeptide repeat-containing protein [Coleofasciculus sp. FACHB-1120]MBD2744041.1 pentapeptide repeat-containing protein [Coleofasciculus sp. FACHB-1120]
MRDETEGLKNWLIILSLTFIAIGVIVFLGLWQLDVVPVEHFNNSSKILTTKEFIELKRQGISSVVEALKIVATTFGGAAILFNVFYAAKRAKAMDDSAIAANKSADAALDNAKAALKNAEAAQDKQITERFTKAIELLGSANISIRLGGIYALERIAKDSKKDHWTIMEVLTAFVRENAPLKEEEIQQEKLPKIPTDIQAALTVIGQRDVDKDPEYQGLNLQYTNLDGADLRDANLQGANLRDANLQGAYLSEANLQEADLSQANLQGPDLSQANLQEADLSQANLQEANLIDANLQGANLFEANLQGANLFEANLQGVFLCRANLQGANLFGANLQGANLFGANLQGANLFRANLQGANLSEAENLELKQIETAFGDSATVLPDDVERPAHWTQAGGETNAIAPI